MAAGHNANRFRRELPRTQATWSSIIEPQAIGVQARVRAPLFNFRLDIRRHLLEVLTKNISIRWPLNYRLIERRWPPRLLLFLSCSLNYSAWEKMEITPKHRKLPIRVSQGTNGSYSLLFDSPRTLFSRWCIVLQEIPDDKDAFHCKVVCLIQQSCFKEALDVINSGSRKGWVWLPTCWWLIYTCVPQSVVVFWWTGRTVKRTLVPLTPWYSEKLS